MLHDTFAEAFSDSVPFTEYMIMCEIRKWPKFRDVSHLKHVIHLLVKALEAFNYIVTNFPRPAYKITPAFNQGLGVAHVE